MVVNNYLLVKVGTQGENNKEEYECLIFEYFLFVVMLQPRKTYTLIIYHWNVSIMIKLINTAHM